MSNDWNTRFSIRWMFLATFVVAWTLAVNRWQGDGYGWRTAIACGIFGGFVLLVDWRTILGAMIGFILLSLVGYFFIVEFHPSSPRFIKAMLLVTAFGGAAGCSINAIFLRRRVLGSCGLLVSVLDFMIY